MSTAAFKRYEKEVEELLGGNQRSPSPGKEGKHERSDESIDEVKIDQAFSDEEEEKNHDMAGWVQGVEKYKVANKNKQSELDADAADYPFAPKISMKSREIWESSPQEPIHERYQKELNKRTQNLKKLEQQVNREKQMEEEGLPIIPLKQGKLNIPQLTKHQKLELKMKSAKAKVKSKSPSIHERKNVYNSGMSWMKERDDKLAEQQSSKLESELSGMSFRPKLNRKNAYYSSISKSFENRQKQFEDEKKFRQIRKECEEYDRDKHKPLINDKSKKIAQKKAMQVQIARKAEMLDKQLRDDDIVEEEEVFRSAPPKNHYSKWSDTLVSDFGASNDSGLPIKQNHAKTSGIYGLKSYPTKITGTIITTIPQHEDSLYSDRHIRNGLISKDYSKSPKRSIGVLSPSPLETIPSRTLRSTSKSPNLITNNQKSAILTKRVYKQHKSKTPAKHRTDMI